MTGAVATKQASDVSKLHVRGCLHDIRATFIAARVHSGSLLWLCIRLHDTNTKCHAGASHTGASSPRFLCRSETFIPARKFISVSCKRCITVCFRSIKVSSILPPYKTRTRCNFSSRPGMKVAPLCKHALSVVSAFLQKYSFSSKTETAQWYSLSLLYSLKCQFDENWHQFFSHFFSHRIVNLIVKHSSI